MVTPNGAQQQQLHAEIVLGVSESDLQEVCLFDFNTALYTVVANGPYRAVVLHWLRWIDQNGHWEQLVRVLRRRFSINQQLMRACDQIMNVQPIPAAKVHTWTIPLTVTISVGTAVLD